MSIKRGPIPADHFTIVPNDALRDKRLSWKARGLLGYLLSHSEGWRTSVNQLIRMAPDGRDSVRSGLAELMEFGYLVRDKQAHGEDGQFSHANYTIKMPDAPWSDNPSTGEPRSDNPPTKKTKPKKTKPKEDQSLNGLAAAPKASDSQLEFLRDLHIHGGGKAGEIEEYLSALTKDSADAEIKEALAVLPRGRDYLGSPDAPGLSEKGREVAARKLVPHA